MGSHPVDTGNLAERLKEQMQKANDEADAAQRPTETTGRLLQEHRSGADVDASVADALLHDLVAANAHGGGTMGSPHKPTNPTSWTQYCEKNRETPEIVPGSGLVRAHFFMSGSACE